MASTLSSIFSSDSKFYPQSNDTFIAPEEVNQSNDNHNMLNGLGMWLGQEDYYFPFSNNFGPFENLPLSECTNNIDCHSSTSNSIMEVPSFGTTSSAFDDNNNSHSTGYTHLSVTGSTTYNELEGNAYSTLQNYVPSSNNYAATLPECWGFQSHATESSGSENSSTKVRKYSAEEKKDRILRYLKKRNQRNFRKTIKYVCRKTLADRRVRIRGRFAKNQEEQSPTSYNHFITQENGVPLPFHNAGSKSENYGEINEEWLQEAMSSLLYVPYINSWHPDRPTLFLSN
ncbi:hypothetical protein BVRB_2g039310 [Beta vulgaris subsp. vulgaris]|nr:hypothetical protein BVRB_2g039310 [Beta vulgaris subsp. vulgaris]